jgi:cob(I)alamin adenosyltransferase
MVIFYSIMLYIFTGNGKGKTTTALGQAMRAVGEEKRVLMVQFIKGPWESGEDKVEIVKRGDPSTDSTSLSQAGSGSPAFKLVKMGKGFVGIMGDTLPRKEHEKAAEETLEYAKKEAESGSWDILILDEVNNAVSLGLISKEKILDLIQNTKYKIQNIILTGRDAPQEFIDRADLVTEMQDIKHPHHKGIKGRRGIEY